MNTIRTFASRLLPQPLRDAWLEVRIAVAQQRLVDAPAHLRHQRGREFMNLICQRSPQQVARMERERGLNER